MPWQRNVYILEGNSGREISGFFQHGRLAISTVYTWLHQVLVSEKAYRLFPCASHDDVQPTGPALLPDSGDAIPPGRYVLLDEEGRNIRTGFVHDMPRRREYSFNYTHTPHSVNFTTRIRHRDVRCCITGEMVPGDNFVGFEAAHIWPLSHTNDFYGGGWGPKITDPDASPSDKINTVQNGFLCTATVHKRFDDYQIGINPDDEYRITEFTGRDPQHCYDGRVFYIDPNLPHHFRPHDDLLRDHFRQCVLACAKGASESPESRSFDPEIDLGPGGFNLAKDGWWATKEGRSQLQVEIAARLHPLAVRQIEQHVF